MKKYYSSISTCHNNGNANAFIDFFLNITYDCIKKTTQKKLSKNQLKIIKLINNNPNITRNEIAKEIGLSVDGVKYNLQKLKNNNIIMRIGPDKGGYYKINDFN